LALSWSVDWRLAISWAVLAFSAKPALKSCTDCEPASALAGTDGELEKAPPKKATKPAATRAASPMKSLLAMAPGLWEGGGPARCGPSGCVGP
jgi:hypothetical protein